MGTPVKHFNKVVTLENGVSRGLAWNISGRRRLVRPYLQISLAAKVVPIIVVRRRVIEMLVKR
jgi:hypothetical protein